MTRNRYLPAILTLLLAAGVCWGQKAVTPEVLPPPRQCNDDADEGAEACADGDMVSLLVEDCLRNWALLWGKGRYAEAATMADEACRLEPNNPTAQYARVLSQLANQTRFVHPAAGCPRSCTAVATSPMPCTPACGQSVLAWLMSDGEECETPAACTAACPSKKTCCCEAKTVTTKKGCACGTACCESKSSCPCDSGCCKKTACNNCCKASVTCACQAKCCTNADVGACQAKCKCCNTNKTCSCCKNCGVTIVTPGAKWVLGAAKQSCACCTNCSCNKKSTTSHSQADAANCTFLRMLQGMPPMPGQPPHPIVIMNPVPTLGYPGIHTGFLPPPPHPLMNIAHPGVPMLAPPPTVEGVHDHVYGYAMVARPVPPPPVVEEPPHAMAPPVLSMPLQITAAGKRVKVSCPRFEARCDRITHLPSGDRILLEGKVRLTFRGKDGGKVSSERVEVDTIDGAVEVNPGPQPTRPVVPVGYFSPVSRPGLQPAPYVEP